MHNRGFLKRPCEKGIFYTKYKFKTEVQHKKKISTLIALSKKLIENFSILDVTLSITHDGDYAIGGVTIELEKSAAANKVQEF